jgi:uncharacterized protein involved in cysteine biosynthesis
MFKFLEFITEFAGWLQIVVSLTLLGLGFGLIIYYLIPNTAGFITGVVIAMLALIMAIIKATRIWKKTGTIKFISRTSETPELDNLQDVEKDK